MGRKFLTVTDIGEGAVWANPCRLERQVKQFAG
jgi:hypothetical protein